MCCRKIAFVSSVCARIHLTVYELERRNNNHRAVCVLLQLHLYISLTIYLGVVFPYFDMNYSYFCVPYVQSLVCFGMRGGEGKKRHHADVRNCTQKFSVEVYLCERHLFRNGNKDNDVRWNCTHWQCRSNVNIHNRKKEANTLCSFIYFGARAYNFQQYLPHV